MRRLSWLGAWPLLVASVVAIAAGVSVVGPDQASEVGTALVVLGAVLLGAWVAMLAGHDYGGESPTDRREDRRN